MKNTVYALARQDPIDHVEAFALPARGSLSPRKPAVARVRISAVEHRWERLSAAGRPHPHAFVQPGGEQWTAVVTRDAQGTDDRVRPDESGRAEDHRFGVFRLSRATSTRRCPRPTIAFSRRRSPRRGRIGRARPISRARERIRAALVETFAAHESRSVQHTLYAMGEAALAACADVTEITLTLPNRHHLLVDLKPFGLDNPNEMFVATDQPFGLIEATIRSRLNGQR